MSPGAGLTALWHRIPWRLVRFGLVGVAATLAYTVLASLFTLGLGWRPVVASVVAYLICTVFSYLSHRRFTFRSSRPVGEEVHRFAGLSVVGWAVAILSPWLLTDQWGLPPLVAILFVSGAVPTLSFLGMERWVFRRAARVARHEGMDAADTDDDKARLTRASRVE